MIRERTDKIKSGATGPGMYYVSDIYTVRSSFSRYIFLNYFTSLCKKARLDSSTRESLRSNLGTDLELVLGEMDHLIWHLKKYCGLWNQGQAVGGWVLNPRKLVLGSVVVFISNGPGELDFEPRKLSCWAY